jgi:hypothetical protein
MGLSYRIWAVLYGLYIWVQATLTIRWVGDSIFKPDDPLFMVIVFVVSFGLVYGAGYFFFKLFKLNPFQRADAAILICAAGLLADIPVFLYTDFFFPDMTAEQFPWFAAWVVWGYGVGILTGVFPKRLAGLPEE